MVQFVAMEDDKAQEPFLTVAARKLRHMHTLDRIALIVVAVVVIVAAVLITQHVSRNREITTAKLTANKTITALAKEDTKAIVSLGDPTFQKATTPAKLKAALAFTYNDKPVTFAGLYGTTTPTVDTTVVTNNSAGQHVVFIYKYDSLKVPYYVRVDTINPAGKNHWYLQGLSFSTDESKLQTGIESSDGSDTDQTQTTLTPTQSI